MLKFEIPAKQIKIFGNAIDKTELVFMDDFCDTFFRGQIRICQVHLTATEPERLISIIRLIAHELSHSIDDCDPISDNWKPELTITKLANELRLDPDIGEQRSSCNLDKTGEAIPDILAAEVLKLYILGNQKEVQSINIKNAILTLFDDERADKTLCAHSEKSQRDYYRSFSYPTYYWRLNHVFGQSPFYRKLLNCN